MTWGRRNDTSTHHKGIHPLYNHSLHAWYTTDPVANGERWVTVQLLESLQTTSELGELLQDVKGFKIYRYNKMEMIDVSLCHLYPSHKSFSFLFIFPPYSLFS